MGNRFGLDVYDVLIVVGFSALVYGVWELSHPAGWIVFGAALVAAGLQSFARKVKR